MFISQDIPLKDIHIHTPRTKHPWTSGVPEHSYLRNKTSLDIHIPGHPSQEHPHPKNKTIPGHPCPQNIHILGIKLSLDIPLKDIHIPGHSYLKDIPLKNIHTPRTKTSLDIHVPEHSYLRNKTSLDIPLKDIHIPGHSYLKTSLSRTSTSTSQEQNIPGHPYPIIRTSIPQDIHITRQLLPSTIITVGQSLLVTR